MKFTSDSFTDGGTLPAQYAFAAFDPKGGIRLSENRNPHFAWSELPAGTCSVALVCHDPDVPSTADDVNKPDRTIPADLPRVSFFHWVLVDMPASGSPIRDGEFSSGVTKKGKSGPPGPRNTRQGLNDYTIWFANDEAMAGNYHGYDGPCPPWNDSIAHRYVFTLYALDIEVCPVRKRFTGRDVLKAIQGHILGSAALTGRYTLNPAVKI